MDRGAWWATVHRAANSQTRLQRLGTPTVLSRSALQRGVQDRDASCVLKTLPSSKDLIRSSGSVDDKVGKKKGRK